MDDFDSSSLTTDLSSEIGHIMDKIKWSEALSLPDPSPLEHRVSATVQNELTDTVSSKRDIPQSHQDTSTSALQQVRLDRLENLVLSIHDQMNSLKTSLNTSQQAAASSQYSTETGHPLPKMPKSLISSVSEKLEKATRELESLRLLTNSPTEESSIPKTTIEDQQTHMTPTRKDQSSKHHVKEENGSPTPSRLQLAHSRVPLDVRYFVQNEIKRTMNHFENSRLSDILELFAAELESRILKAVDERLSQIKSPRVRWEDEPSPLERKETIESHSMPSRPHRDTDSDVEALLNRLRQKLDQKVRLIHDFKKEVHSDDIPVKAPSHPYLEKRAASPAKTQFRKSTLASKLKTKAFR